MMKILIAVTALGGVILFFFYFLPQILLMLAAKTDMGNGHFVIFFPPHADPMLRWHGVLTGVALTGLGSLVWFVSDKNREFSQKPVFRLIGTVVVLGAITGWTAVQSYVDQQPDYLAQQYFALRDRHRSDSIGIGWPAQEADNSPQRRATLDVVIAYHPDRERDPVYVKNLADLMYLEWQQACHQAALADGAAFSDTRMVRPQQLMKKYPVVDPKNCVVYIEGQDTGWGIKRDQQGISTIWGRPPLQ